MSVTGGRPCRRRRSGEPLPVSLTSSPMFRDRRRQVGARECPLKLTGGSTKTRVDDPAEVRKKDAHSSFSYGLPNTRACPYERT